MVTGRGCLLAYGSNVVLLWFCITYAIAVRLRFGVGVLLQPGCIMQCGAICMAGLLAYVMQYASARHYAHPR